MLELGKFYLRIGKQEKADQCLRDAFSFQIKNQRIGLLYAAYLIQLTRSKEAIVILNRLKHENYSTIQVNLLLSLAYEQDQDQLLSQKYKSMALLERLRELDLISLPGTALENKPQAIPPSSKQNQTESEASNKVESFPAYNNQRLTSDQEDQLYLEIASLMTNESIYPLALKFLGKVQNQENLFCQQNLGDTNLNMQKYEEALKCYNWILSKDETNLACICNIGHCNFLLKRYQEAEEAYIRAVRVSSFSGNELQDSLVLQRLGAIYVHQKQFEESAVIFQQCYAKYQNSFCLLNFGITCIYKQKPDY